MLSPNVATKVIENLAEVSEGSRPRRTTDLTVREIEILEMLYQGLRNAAIGDRLKISTRTVEAHVRNVISKLGAQNRTEAVQIALRDRMIRQGLPLSVSRRRPSETPTPELHAAFHGTPKAPLRDISLAGC